MHNGAMTGRAAAKGQVSPLIVAICGGIAVSYLFFLGEMLLTHRWIVDAGHRPLATDFISFWSAGHLASLGKAALAYDWPAMHRLQTTMMAHESGGYFGWAYPPLFFCVAVLLAAMPYASAFLLWVGITILLYAFAIGRIARDRGTILLACATPAVLACAMVGQNGFLSAFLIAMILLALETRPLLAGLLLGLLTYKPHLGLLFPVALICGGHWRAFLAAAISVAGVLLLSWLIAPESLAAFFAHLGGMSDNFLSHGTAGFYKQQSLYGVLRTLGVGDRPAFGAQGMLLVAMLGLVGWLWRSGYSASLKAAGLTVATLLATPYLYYYDLPILSVAIAFLWRDRAFARSEGLLIIGSQLALAVFTTVNAPMGFVASLLVLAVLVRRMIPGFKVAPRHRTA